ncbi:MAG: monovalent cation:proton antiporter-2 (CPA2) family protein [Chromatiales bacterium]
MLGQIAIFLAAAVLIVPLFKRLGLGTVLGYLVAGMLIGPWGLRVVSDVENTLHFSELGVVLLLFIIGLELQPSRLWVLRRTVFAMGSAQVLLTALLIALPAAMLAQGWLAAAVIGIGAAMSSTAFVLQTLAERGELTARHGRESFAILLFQDLAVIPVLAIVPLLAVGPELSKQGVDWTGIARALAVIIAMLVLGRQLLRLAFRAVARFGNREIFTAAALLVVIGTALLMHYLGLSMSLGAFLAGVLLADSEFRHEIEAELEPFKGLLLGLFFIAVGMSVNLGLIREQALLLVGLAIAVILVKFAVLYLVGRLAGASSDTARNLGIALAAGGEFAFVLFSLARDHRIIAANTAETLVMVITLSMMLAPVLFVFNDRLLKRWAARHEEPEYDRIEESANPVVIAGFGRFGQIIARILRMRGIAFTALDSSQTQVDFVRKFGSKIYYGDASRLALLHAAKVENTRLFVLAISNVETSVKIAAVLRRHLPHVPIYARARNRFHCYKLMDLNVDVLYRDTYLSSLEMAREVLCGLGLGKADAERTVRMFREYDEALIKKQHAIYHDETALIQSARQASDELRSLFESDATGPVDPLKAPATGS